MTRYKEHFNSIKVRLELVSSMEYSESNPLFQFHKGTIRTRGAEY